MSRWVTFYFNFITDHVADLRAHKDRETALKYFNANCKRYFGVNILSFKAENLPACYGFAHRKYFGISARAFKNMFGISIDEALKEAKEGGGAE